MRSLRTVENDAALKRKEILTPATTQGNLEAVMLRERSQTEGHTLIRLRGLGEGTAVSVSWGQSLSLGR